MTRPISWTPILSQGDPHDCNADDDDDNARDIDSDSYFSWTYLNVSSLKNNHCTKTANFEMGEIDKFAQKKG